MEDVTELKFNTQVKSQFACRSADNQTVATKPSGNMICGSAKRLYKYEGVFANTSLLTKKESSIEFSITFQQTFLQSPNYVKFPIFELGFTNDSISTLFLHPILFSVSAFPCQKKFSVCLLTGSGVLIESKTIFKSETNSRYAEGRFILKYRPSEHTLFLLAKSPKVKSTIELHRVQSMNLRSPLWPVFAAYDFNEIAVSMNIKTNEVGFDRYTLHQNLYISHDNKTMSNKNLSGTYQITNFTTPIIWMRPRQIGISNDFHTMIDIDFDDSNGGHVFFKIGIRGGKDTIFNATLLLECMLCEVGYFLGLYRTIGYCLSVANGTKYIAVSHNMKLFLHYNQDGIIELYVPNYVWGYSYCLIQFEPFRKTIPEFYIEKVDAKDIAISSSRTTNIDNRKRIMVLGRPFDFLGRRQEDFENDKLGLINVAGPWEGRPTIREEPCPPCRVPIPIQCLGLHEEEEEEKKRLLNEEEIKQQQAKVEECEKRMGKGRKRRNEYDEEEEEKLSFILQHKKLLIMSLTVAVLAIFAYSLLLQ
ncbi:uncharacterized protein LOC127713974 [Mytilus californianus]|uniref:uncharacterized protein LOC127713974 n=1 Tax=Mytilus californianus TaxID=6549 RepID=UPI0022461B71|nr:uncharacterized protein LOC127713974 [Mytilus californianus]